MFPIGVVDQDEDSRANRFALQEELRPFFQQVGRNPGQQRTDGRTRGETHLMFFLFPKQKFRPTSELERHFHFLLPQIRIKEIRMNKGVEQKLLSLVPNKSS